jgi:hypothetical protein
MAHAIRVAVAAAVVATALLAASTASPMGAFQTKTDCFFAPGDIPGVPFFTVPKGHVVITPNGQLHVTCHGATLELARLESERRS